MRVKQSGVILTKNRRWPVDDVTGIGIRDNEESTGDFHIFDLRIRLASGAKTGFFRGREEELNWIATVLRREVDLSSEETDQLGKG